MQKVPVDTKKPPVVPIHDLKVLDKRVDQVVPEMLKFVADNCGDITNPNNYAVAMASLVEAMAAVIYDEANHRFPGEEFEPILERMAYAKTRMDYIPESLYGSFERIIIVRERP